MSNLEQLQEQIQKINLKDGQAKAIKGLLQWYKYRTSLREIATEGVCAILKGSPGTGKSFTVTQFILNLVAELKITNPKDFKVLLVAPTNQAKENLRDFSQEANLWKYATVTCMTVHSLGGMILQGLSEEGYQMESWGSDREKFKPSLIIADEYSMINEFTYNQVALEIFDCFPTLFVGDLDQLSSVSDKKHPDTLAIGESIVDELNPNFRFNLTEVVRFQGNILTYIHEIKKNIPPIIYSIDAEGNETAYPNPNVRFKASLPDPSICGSDVQVMTKEEFLDSKIGRLAENPRVWSELNYLKVAAYTNVGVNSWNQTLRRARFKSDEDYYRVNPGELMIVKDPVYGYVDGEIRRLFYTNQKFKPAYCEDSWQVVEYLPSQPRLHFQILTATNVYNRSTEFLFPSQETLNTLNTEFMSIFHKLKASKKDASTRAKDWNLFNQQLKIWGLAYKGDPTERNPLKRQTTFYYGSTIHSLQGTTLDHVILDWKDILKARKTEDQKRLVYVAASRARKTLTILT